MFKFYQNQLPRNMTNLFTANFQLHSYDTRHADDCHLPRKSSGLRQYSLAYQGPKIWYIIDSKTRQIKSFYLFKKKMKSYIIIIDKIAVANYPSNKNKMHIMKMSSTCSFNNANQSQCHKNGLALKQRHKGTRKWPIQTLRLHPRI